MSDQTIEEGERKRAPQLADVFPESQARDDEREMTKNRPKNDLRGGKSEKRKKVTSDEMERDGGQMSDQTIEDDEGKRAPQRAEVFPQRQARDDDREMTKNRPKNDPRGGKSEKRKKVTSDEMERDGGQVSDQTIEDDEGKRAPQIADVFPQGTMIER